MFVTKLFLTYPRSQNHRLWVIFARKVRQQISTQELFRAADDDGDGHLSPEEFVEALSLPSVQGELQMAGIYMNHWVVTGTYGVMWKIPGDWLSYCDSGKILSHGKIWGDFLENTKIETVKPI